MNCRSSLTVTWLLVATLALAGAACAPKHARAVRGYWELTTPGGGRYPGDGTFNAEGALRWFIVDEGQSSDEASMLLPTGIGCIRQTGTWRRGVMDFSRANEQVVLRFTTSRDLILRYQAEPDRSWRYTRTSRRTVVGCE